MSRLLRYEAGLCTLPRLTPVHSHIYRPAALSGCCNCAPAPRCPLRTCLGWCSFIVNLTRRFLSLGPDLTFSGTLCKCSRFHVMRSRTSRQVPFISTAIWPLFIISLLLTWLMAPVCFSGIEATGFFMAFSSSRFWLNELITRSLLWGMVTHWWNGMFILKVWGLRTFWTEWFCCTVAAWLGIKKSVRLAIFSILSDSITDLVVI